MKPGDLIRLKQGTLGLQGNDLLAIYLDRIKRGKQYLVVCHTTKGNKELSKDNVSSVALKSRVDDPSSMTEGELGTRLEQLRAELAGTAPEERGGRLNEIGDDLDDRRVWELVVNDVEGSITPEEAARMILEDPTGEDVGEIRSVLQSCQQKGVGYFERAEGRGERYRPYTVDQIKAVRREIEGLRKLRNKLIHVREIEDPESGVVDTLIEGVPISEVTLDADDERRLEIIAEHMTDFVLHDTDRGQVGLADTPIHTLDGFILNRFTRFLAFDWLGGKGTSTSGAYVSFLIEAGLMDVREANTLVARRHVNLSEFMSFEYPERALKAAERLPDEIPEAWYEGRRDLRGLETYTIDPPDAKDFDDAVSFETDGEDTLLYVHIADVAQYVEPGSTIDFEARDRGTSTYLPTGVLPMLPPRLADNLCSLRAGEPRPAMTAIMRVNPDGEVTEHEVCESIIEVDENKSYDDALEALDADQEPFVSLHALAQRLGTTRSGLELETDELKVHIESDKVDPHLKSGNEATRMIERFMVAANEAVANFLDEHDVPAPYRCHPLPDRYGVERFNKQMEIMETGLSLELPDLDEDDEDEEEEESFLEALQGGKVELVGGGFVTEKEDEPAEDEADEDDKADAGSGAPTMEGLAQLDPEDRAAVLEPFNDLLTDLQAIDDKQLRGLIHLKLLGCLGRAFYTPENIGHFGLGSVRYLHFTSPIRRYPDLVVHRQLKWLLRGGAESEQAHAYAGETPPHEGEELATLCPKNTDQSIEAEQLERDLIGVALAFEARTEAWSGAHRAMVNGITKGGVFVSLEKGVEARLGTSDIPGGPWDVDESGAMLFKGERSTDAIDEEQLKAAIDQDWREQYNDDLGEMVQVRLRLGDRLNAKIRTIDLAMGKISVGLATASSPGT